MENFAIWFFAFLLFVSCLYVFQNIIYILKWIFTPKSSVTIGWVSFILPPILYICMVNCKGWNEFSFTGKHNNPTVIEKIIIKTDTVYVNSMDTISKIQKLGIMTERR